MVLFTYRILLDRVVSTAGGFISSVTNANNAEPGNQDEQAVNPTASVSESDSESSIPSTSTSASPTADVDVPPDTGEDDPPEVVSSEGAEIIPDLEVDGVSSGRKDLESSLQNKSAELEDDTLVAAAEGEDKGAEVVDALTSSSSFAHSASGEGSAAGVLDSVENDDPTNPSK